MDRKEYVKQYQEINRERIAERKRLFYIEHKEEILAKQREYLNNNRESVNAQHRKYYAINHDHMRSILDMHQTARYFDLKYFDFDNEHVKWAKDEKVDWMHHQTELREQANQYSKCRQVSEFIQEYFYSHGIIITSEEAEIKLFSKNL